MAAVAGLLVFLFAFAQAQSEAEKKAETAAGAWLKLVDRGGYGESWDEAASMFKDKVPRAAWEKMAHSVRKPLGELRSRKLLRAQYTKELPGVPDGEYVVIQYGASYANKQSAVETVTPMLEKDGQWRVSGYYIR